MPTVIEDKLKKRACKKTKTIKTTFPLRDGTYLNFILVYSQTIASFIAKSCLLTLVNVLV